MSEYAILVELLRKSKTPSEMESALRCRSELGLAEQHSYLGMALQIKGNYQMAIRKYSDAIETNGLDIEMLRCVRANRAVLVSAQPLWQNLWRTKKALADLEFILKDESKLSPVHLLTVSTVFFLLKMYSAAEVFLQIACEHSQDSSVERIARDRIDLLRIGGPVCVRRQIREKISNKSWLLLGSLNVQVSGPSDW